MTRLNVSCMLQRMFPVTPSFVRPENSARVRHERKCVNQRPKPEEILPFQFGIQNKMIMNREGGWKLMTSLAHQY